MEERNFAQIDVPRSIRARLMGVLLALRGKDVLFDQGAQIKSEGQVYTLAKLAVALWVATDEPLEAHKKLALGVERALGRAMWDEPLEEKVAAER